MLRSITKQLCLQIERLPEEIKKNLQKKYDKGERPDEQDLLHVIQALVENIGSVYLIIDALDECVEIPHLLKSLHILSELQLKNVHSLMTSRDLPEIRRSMDKIAITKMPIGSSERRYTGIDDDIDLFVNQSLIDHYYLSVRSDRIKKKIRETLKMQACGMYVVDTLS